MPQKAVPHSTQRKTATGTARTAISRALTQELRRATPDHVRVSAWKLTGLDVQEQWALANVDPIEPLHLDPITVLLHQQKGVWKVKTLGTNLRGSGRKFGAPRKLWKKWAL